MNSVVDENSSFIEGIKTELDEFRLKKLLRRITFLFLFVIIYIYNNEVIFSIFLLFL